MILLQDRVLDLPAPRAPTLPRFETSFLGRDGELAALRAALRGERLVTLVGAAGVGKTRLAAETAAGVPDVRVWWVDLGSVVAGRVTASIARTLAVPEVPGRAPADLVVARLRESRALLVLDNCEHVRPRGRRLCRARAGGRPARADPRHQPRAAAGGGGAGSAVRGVARAGRRAAVRRARSGGGRR